jgi:6-phosphofructokinase
MVSGGIAPGINAVIHGIVSRHELYRAQDPHRYNLHIRGCDEGFRTLLAAGDAPPRQLTLADVVDAPNRGGSILATARAQDLLDRDPGSRRQAM